VSKLLARSARKRFGQNFLIDMRVIDTILASISPTPTDHVVEIGPGHGAITEGLLASGCNLTMIELDRDLIPQLMANFVSQGVDRCRLINEDVLKVDFRTLSGPLRVVGNLPYNISTPLLFKLLGNGDHFTDIHVMLQKEVVKRICSIPGDPAYGRLGVMIQALAEVEMLIDVPPESFAPAPKVDSGVIRIIPRANLREKINDYAVLERVVKTAFSQRRKTLRNNFKEWIPANELEAVGINPNDRPEIVPVKTFVALANQIAKIEAI
jgi:16S rRNA (adenine1518-N6/adenine1519-N6)-dimethyltransferase